MCLSARVRRFVESLMKEQFNVLDSHRIQVKTGYDRNLCPALKQSSWRRYYDILRSYASMSLYSWAMRTSLADISFEVATC